MSAAVSFAGTRCSPSDIHEIAPDVTASRVVPSDPWVATWPADKPLPPLASDRRKDTCECEHCPICGPVLAARKQRRHARALERAQRAVYLDRGADGLGSVWSVDAEDEGDGRAPKPRMSRPLTPSQWQAAFEQIEATPCRAWVARDEWERLVWHELLEPSVLVYGRETRLRIATKVENAITRAQARLSRAPTLPAVRLTTGAGRTRKEAGEGIPYAVEATAPIKEGDVVRIRKREGTPLRDLVPRFRVVSIKRKYAEIEDVESKEPRKLLIGELERV